MSEGSVRSPALCLRKWYWAKGTVHSLSCLAQSSSLRPWQGVCMAAHVSGQGRALPWWQGVVAKRVVPDGGARSLPVHVVSSAWCARLGTVHTARLCCAGP